MSRINSIGYSSLTEDHKRMIRGVRKMQLIVARKQFQVNEYVQCRTSFVSLIRFPFFF